jgi:hypothetical protein
MEVTDKTRADVKVNEHFFFQKLLFYIADQ